MPFRRAHARPRRKVVFSNRAIVLSEREAAPKNLKRTMTQARMQELSLEDNDTAFEDVESSIHRPKDCPSWIDPNTSRLVRDDLVTASSEAEAKVADDCLPLLLGEDNEGLPLNSHGIPHLRRKEHATFLHSNLGNLPAPYVAMDASRPWVFYWVIAGLSFLGEDVSQYKERLMQTLQPLQNVGGGFGGGHGQLSHCAVTYASLLALACVGGLEMVDRRAMWQFLGTVKQSDGGFKMAPGGEEDVRGAYCAMTAISLLNLPLELPPEAPAREAGLTTFLDGLGEWIGRCQTYEGGIGGAPTNEAHGAYAFCALACLSIIDAPHISIPKYIDIQGLIHWLAASQTVPEGGFAGRTNKLVDACYSHWSGGCWSLLEAAVAGSRQLNYVSSFWNREAQIRYLLCCCQRPGKHGGMRDKPSARPDAYHTCYSVSGLSAAQNHYHYNATFETSAEESERLTAAFHWSAQNATLEEQRLWAFDDQDRVQFVHPVFVIPFYAVEKAYADFKEELPVKI